MNLTHAICDSRRIPCLDGWRFVSITLVLISHSIHVTGFPHELHSWIRWLPDGGFGVDFFFVISGFIITFLLLREINASGNICIRGFFIRRALRILPAYIFFLFIIFLVESSTKIKITNLQWFSLLSYTANYIYPPWIASHIWSLSVEEQFYLIWPAVFLFTLKKEKKYTYIILLLPIIIAPVCRTIGYVKNYPLPVNNYSFLNQCDSISVGCILAFIKFYHGETLQKYICKYKIKILILALLLILVPLIFKRLFIFGVFTVPFDKSCCSLGDAILISISITYPESRIFRWLEWKPIVSIGVMSYSIYLWQQIFCTNPKEYGFDYTPWFLSFPYWIVPVCFVAFISYNFIEKPFLRLKSRLT